MIVEIFLICCGIGYVYFMARAARNFGDVVRTQLEINDTVEELRASTDRAQIAALGEQDDT